MVDVLIEESTVVVLVSPVVSLVSVTVTMPMLYINVVVKVDVSSVYIASIGMKAGILGRVFVVPVDCCCIVTSSMTSSARICIGNKSNEQKNKVNSNLFICFVFSFCKSKDISHTMNSLATTNFYQNALIITSYTPVYQQLTSNSGKLISIIL